MSHPDFKTPAQRLSEIEGIAKDLTYVRSKFKEIAADCGYPDAPVSGEKMDILKFLLDQDAALTDQLADRFLAARTAGLMEQFIEFATMAEAGRP